MQPTTLVSGLTALALTNTAVALNLRPGNAWRNNPSRVFSALADWPAAQSWCSSAYAVASTVTATVTTTLIAPSSATASISNTETVAVTESSTAVAASTLLPKAKRGKCRKASATASISAFPSSTSVSPGVKASQDALYSSLISSPSSVAESACRRYIETPATVTATSTIMVSGVATAASQSASIVTSATAAIVSGSSTLSETTSISSTTSTSTATSTSETSTAPAASKCSNMGQSWTSSNDLVFSLSCNALYGATETNTISQTEQADFTSCLDLCSLTSGCGYLLYVEAEGYGMARQCYLLNSDDGGFGFGFDGIATAQLIAA